MFLESALTKCVVFQVSKNCICLLLRNILIPQEEKAGMTKTAAPSVHLNVAEGCSGISVAE
ncbi:MAG: hypothetical protein JWM28_3079 [Chitinophagaceae bacterium]|nr:hypothetical protein [Chitinophagaceae bacterium]